MTAITLLDGGMGQELLSRVTDAPTGLWSTKVMADHPGLVADVHRDYFAAGATVATTNTYAVHLDRLDGTEFDGQQADLIAQAMDEAHAARDAAGGGTVAGAIGPLVWSYNPDGQPDYPEARALYAGVARLLAPHADVIIIETMASLDMARAALDGAREAGLPVWLGVTVDDEDGAKLRSGEPVASLAELKPDAFLANCSAPEAMPTALAALAAFGVPFGAYANGFVKITKEFLSPGSTVGALAKRDMPPETYAEHVLTWVDQGATIVGGCCEVGPAHIREIHRRLTAAGHDIV